MFHISLGYLFLRRASRVAGADARWRSPHPHGVNMMERANGVSAAPKPEGLRWL